MKVLYSPLVLNTCNEFGCYCIYTFKIGLMHGNTDVYMISFYHSYHVMSVNVTVSITEEFVPICELMYCFDSV